MIAMMMQCIWHEPRGWYTDRKFTFSGSFSDHDNVPHSLLALVSMILEGPKINHQQRADTKAAISISQLLIFNSVKHARATDASATSHALEWETPLPLYLAEWKWTPLW